MRPLLHSVLATIFSRLVQGGIALLLVARLEAQALRITGIDLDAAGRPHVRHTAEANSYFVLLRGNILGDLSNPRDVRLGSRVAGELTDLQPSEDVSLYRVWQIPVDAPEDLDRDGLDDVYELQRAPILNPLDGTDAQADSDGDLRPNLFEAQAGTDPLIADFFVTTSPTHRETGVSVNRETVFRFTAPLADNSVLNSQRMWAEAGGRRLLTRVELSADRRSAILFPLEPVPGATHVRVFLDGSGLSDALNRPLDLDADGQPGGVAAIEFTTSAIAPVAGTGVIGRVFASEWVADSQVPGGFTNRPLGGVTVTVDGAEETLRTVTDVEGRFTLAPVPAGRFFVHVDGRTVSDPQGGIQWPDLAYYPFVGKAWTAQAGVSSNLAGGSGEIFLPLIPAGALTPVDPLAETKITFTPDLIAANPALAGVEITVPPNALFDNGGVRGGRVGLAPVPADRLPEPLPEGLKFPLVITVQTSGPENFDRPVPVRFPNLPDPETGILLPAGAKSALWSFNHDTGQWEIAGPVTASADGKYLDSDPGVGIRQPGWHGTMPGSGGGGPPPGKSPPPNPKPRPPRPPGPPPQPPGPPPPPPPPVDDGNDNDQQGLPGFPELPDIPFVDEPESWGDVVDSIVDKLPTLGPDIYGDIVDIGETAVDLADEIGDAMDGTPDYSGGDPDTLDALEDAQDFLDSIGSAASDQLPSFPDNASDASNTLKDWWDIWNELYGSGNRRGNQRRRAPLALGTPPSAARIPLLELQREGVDWERLATLQTNWDGFFQAWLGAERWNRLVGTGVGYFEILPLLRAMLAAQDNPTAGGMQITPAEASTILALASPLIPAGLGQELIDRLNLTAANYAAGIVFHSQAPANAVDFADAREWRDATRQLARELRIEQEAGFTSPAGRGQSLVRRVGPALGGFFGAFLDSTPLEPAEDNEYYVLLEVFTEGSPVRRQYLRTNLRGELSGLIVAANSLGVVHWLNPETGQTASGYFQSGSPGSKFRIPRAIWNDRVDSVDGDQDGLSDGAENIVGTFPHVADSDGDGVLDGGEVRAGTNPLDGIVLQPGISGSADTPGNAVDVAVETYDLSPFGGSAAVTRILVADGEVGGVAVMELLNQQPVMLGRLDTAGDARRVALPNAGGLLAEEIGLGAVADGPAGLDIVDFIDPVNPRVRQQIPLPGITRCVTIAGAVVFSGTEAGRLVTVDLFSGEVLGELNLGFPIHDLRVSSGVLFVAGPRAGKLSLQVVPLSNGGLLGASGERVDSEGFAGRRGVRLSVGDGLAFLVHGRGFNTFNVTNPQAPQLIASGFTGQFGWKQLAPDGTGLAVACVGANSTDDGPHEVAVYEVSDPTQTDRLITTVVTPGLASAVTVHAGRAFVADGQAGLQVIDYTSGDRGNQVPTAQLAVRPEGPVVSASPLLAVVSVADDGPVREVELWVDGALVARDLSWPFEFSFQAPVYTPFNTNLVVQARALDSAGNASFSAPVTRSLVLDTLPPLVQSFGPSAGRTVAGPDLNFTVTFSEAMDPATLHPGRIQLVAAGLDAVLGTADDVFVSGETEGYLERAHASLLRFKNVPSGDYRIVVSDAVSDASGNRMGTAVTSDFRVFEADLRSGGDFVAEGQLPANGTRDEYGFLAQEGQVLYFDLQSPPSLGLEWSLRDETGAQVFGGVAIGDRGEVMLHRSGRYRLSFLRVGDMVADYRIKVWDVPAPQEFALAIGETISDGVPAAGAGHIESPASLDRYTFTATPGQQVYFDLISGASAGLAWRLTDETGAEVFDAGFIGDRGVVTLTLGGTYMLTLGHPQRDFVGPYSFKLWDVPAPQEFALAIGDIVSDGMPAVGAGHIESPGSLDRYTFTATPGQQVYFDLISGISVGLAWRLTDETGAEVFEAAFIGDRGVVTLTLGGMYTLTLGHSQRDFVGPYSFQLWDVPAPQEFALAIGDIVSDGVPAAGAGRIESPGSLDRYTFTATPGQQVYFDLVSGISVGLAWRLTDETGAEVFEAAFIGDRGVVTLTLGGTYTLIVGHSQRDFVGPYSFKLWDVPAPQEFALAIGDIVSDGVPTTGAGRIESPGSLDRYTFTATPGQQVYFDVISGISVGLAWRLTDEAGAEIFDAAFIGDAGLVTLTQGGVYQLTVGHQGRDFTGPYSFKIQLNP